MLHKLYTFQNISQLRRLIPNNSGIFAIIDNNVEEFFTEFKDWNFICIEACEEIKSLDAVAAICSVLMEKNADRDCFIVGAGGGVTTDLAGFVASVYKRGVRFGLVPTTVLAACDAAVGGKNGVNHGGVKNMVGSVKFPLWTFQSTLFFKTLPSRVFREGVAEMLKTFLITDKDLFNESAAFFHFLSDEGECCKAEGKALSNVGECCKAEGKVSNKVSECCKAEGKALSDVRRVELSLRKEGVLRRLIKECALRKMELVEKDPYDRRQRRLLNLGHTFGHALESYAAQKPELFPDGLLHGEAVAAGTVAAAKTSLSKGLLKEDDCKAITKAFADCGVLCNYNVPASRLLKYIYQDKKIRGQKLHMILPQGIGKVKGLDVDLADLKTLSKEIIL